MIIESSNISLNSNHQLIQKKEESESLRYWRGSPENARTPLLDTADFSPEALAELRKEGESAEILVDLKQGQEELIAAQAAEAMEEVQEAEEEVNDPELQLLKMVIEYLTGEKVETPRLKLEQAQEVSENLPENVSEGEANWGLEYDYHRLEYEREQTTFEAQGVVKTKDGKEINFQINLQMYREHIEAENVSIRMGNAKKVDPLVINFHGNATDLTDQKFEFDLDADGSKENISFVGQGSGFIAFDRNKDGKINDGSELFGPQTGNGFSELARYDEDGNDFIDEGDSIYQDLSVWQKDAEGKDILTPLAQKNVAAIYLKNVATPFSVKDQANQSQGEIKDTSIYIQSNGSVGSIQELDLYS